MRSSSRDNGMARQGYTTSVEEWLEAWNAWRQQNPGFDISGANLTSAHLVNACLAGSNLRGTNLTGANLSGADLVDANLTGADLTGANLGYARAADANFRGAYLPEAYVACANLRGANLRGANLANAYLAGIKLTEADLGGANLTGANLTFAKLHRADLTSANLTRADLSRAVVAETIFANVDLSKTRGLEGVEGCSHDGPSAIDHRTLRLSGQLPLSFLRGCGLSDWEIQATKVYKQGISQEEITDIAYEIARLRGEQPIQFYSCFISYSSKDDDFAGRLHADLQDTGIRCWFAPEDMKIGDRIRTRIDEVIRLHEKLLLVLSANSIDSDWVEKEVETAFEKERQTKSTVLFPVRLDDAVIESKAGWAADIKRARHIGDFRRWKDQDGYHKAFKRLVRDLRVELTA